MKLGTVVIAKAGKDKGGVFAVVKNLDSRYVLIADGKRRPLEKPKKKNKNHLQRTDAVIDEIGTNLQLRTKLDSYTGG